MNGYNMHRAFLNRYFHIDYWTQDLLAAFFSVRPSWNVDELTTAFVDVCCELQAPRGAASGMVTWLNYLVGQRRLKLEDKVLTLAGISWAKPRRSLKAAIGWSMARVDIRKQSLAQTRPLWDAPSGEAVQALIRIRDIRRTTNSRLSRVNKRFRLKPQKNTKGTKV